MRKLLIGLLLCFGLHAETVDYQVSASGDDAGETGGGSVSLVGTTYYWTGDQQYRAGLMFRGVTIPVGAAITAAYVSVWPGGDNGDDPDATIWAEDNATPADFAATASNLSSRTSTTATVAWSADNVGYLQYVNTPSIVDIIQELVDTYDYSAGRDVAIVLEDDLTNDSGASGRTYDYDTTNVSGKLHIEFTPAGGGGGTVIQGGTIAGGTAQ